MASDKQHRQEAINKAINAWQTNPLAYTKYTSFVLQKTGQYVLMFNLTLFAYDQGFLIKNKEGELAVDLSELQLQGSMNQISISPITVDIDGRQVKFSPELGDTSIMSTVQMDYTAIGPATVSRGNLFINNNGGQYGSISGLNIDEPHYVMLGGIYGAYSIINNAGQLEVRQATFNACDVSNMKLNFVVNSQFAANSSSYGLTIGRVDNARFLGLNLDDSKPPVVIKGGGSLSFSPSATTTNFNLVAYHGITLEGAFYLFDSLVNVDLTNANLANAIFVDANGKIIAYGPQAIYQLFKEKGYNFSKYPIPYLSQAFQQDTGPSLTQEDILSRDKDDKALVYLQNLQKYLDQHPEDYDQAEKEKILCAVTHKASSEEPNLIETILHMREQETLLTYALLNDLQKSGFSLKQSEVYEITKSIIENSTIDLDAFDNLTDATLDLLKNYRGLYAGVERMISDMVVETVDGALTQERLYDALIDPVRAIDPVLAQTSTEGKAVAPEASYAKIKTSAAGWFSSSTPAAETKDNPENESVLSL